MSALTYPNLVVCPDCYATLPKPDAVCTWCVEHPAPVADPFRGIPGYGAPLDVASRLQIVRDCNAAQCSAALRRDDLQATVRKALERRLRVLDKADARRSHG